MCAGAEVVRGPDWPLSNTIDGGSRGHVTAIQPDGMVLVQWASATTPSKHRWGARSSFDLALTFYPPTPAAYPPFTAQPGSQPHLQPPHFVTTKPMTPAQQMHGKQTQSQLQTAVPEPSATAHQPSNLKEAIQASHYSPQWGFYGDATKFVPFKTVHCKVE